MALSPSFLEKLPDIQEVFIPKAK